MRLVFSLGKHARRFSDNARANASLVARVTRFGAAAISFGATIFAGYKGISTELRHVGDKLARLDARFEKAEAAAAARFETAMEERKDTAARFEKAQAAAAAHFDKLMADANEERKRTSARLDQSFLRM